MASWWAVLIVSACTIPCCSGVRTHDDDVLQADAEIVERSTALCFAGGGWRAHAADTAFVAGLIMSSSPMSISEAMKSFDAVGCNSGGCWFSSAMLWSQNFNNIMEDMARRPQYAQRLYYANIGHAFRDLKAWHTEGPSSHPVEVSCCDAKSVAPCGTGLLGDSMYIKYNGVKLCCPSAVVNGCKRKRLLPCGTGFHGKPHEVMFGDTPYCCPDPGAADLFNAGDACLDIPVAENNLRELGTTLKGGAQFLLDRAIDWQSFAGAVAEVPGGFDSTMPLSTPPLGWAVGKDWTLSTSLLAPAQHNVGLHKPPVAVCESGGFMKADRYLGSYLDDEASEKLNGWDCFGGLCGSQVPARFSVTLGTRRSPLNFTSVTGGGVLGMMYGVWERSWVVLGSKPKYLVHSKAGLPSWPESYEAPIRSAIGSSSAFVGFEASRSQKWWLGGIQRLFPIWVQNRITAISVQFSAAYEHMDGANFAERKEQVRDCTQTDDAGVDAAAAGHVVGMVDGGMTDNVGFTHLIVAGHTNILIVQNTAKFTLDNQAEMHKAIHQLLSGDKVSTWSQTDIDTVAGYPVFEENATYVINEMKQHFKQFKAPPSSLEMDSVWIGELKLTTIDSEPYGIVGGQSVTLRWVICAAKTLSVTVIAPGPTSIYAGEIVETFALWPELRNTISAWSHGGTLPSWAH